jgi:hypothetical protein
MGTEAHVQTAGGALYSIKWGFDETGNMVAIDSQLVSVQMIVTVPEGVSSGQSVTVNGSVVTVPEGLTAGDNFAHNHIQVPPVAGPAQEATSQEPSIYGPQTEEDVDARVAKLSSSFKSQGKAIFSKTWALQKKKCCQNFCLCSCPSLSLIIAFLAQWLFESFGPDLVSTQRCTYCGTSSDPFGKAYCGGKPCEDYFFPLECTRGKGNCDIQYTDCDDSDIGWKYDLMTVIWNDANKSSVGQEEGLSRDQWSMLAQVCCSIVVQDHNI